MIDISEALTKRKQMIESLHPKRVNTHLVEKQRVDGRRKRPRWNFNRYAEIETYIEPAWTRTPKSMGPLLFIVSAVRPWCDDGCERWLWIAEETPNEKKKTTKNNAFPRMTIVTAIINLIVLLWQSDL